MARRKGRPGDWLGTDEYYGFTCYQSELKQDFWGAYAKKPLKRNLQEIDVPLSDPYPVFPIQGASYQIIAYVSALVIAPATVGVTSVPTNRNNMAIQSGVVE